MDKSNGLVHHVQVNAANVHDMTTVPQMLHSDEASVHGDSGYLGTLENNKGR